MGIKEIEFEECEPTSFRDLGEGYINAFVTFIDILGFKQIIQNKRPEDINQILDAVALFSKLPQQRTADISHKEALPIVIQFSDSIIRIQPTIGTNELNIARCFYGELGSLLLMHGNLVCNGILIRGGLTYGEVCVRGGRVFGPAFNRAYFIESCLARYPRIIIDEFLMFDNQQNPIREELGSDVWPDILELLYRSEDGQWILDYLPHLCFAERSSDITVADVLVAHRDSIKKLLRESIKSGHEESKNKIRWVASYHNKIIERSFSRLCDDFDSKQDSLIIDLDDYA